LLRRVRDGADEHLAEEEEAAFDPVHRKRCDTHLGRSIHDGEVLRVAFGGTFDRIHKGHRTIFEKAFGIGDEVVIGVTSDEMAEKARGHTVLPIGRRREKLDKALRSAGYEDFEIVEISDVYGPAPYLENLDAIVTSEDTRKTAEEINRMREENGLNPLEIHVVPMVLAEDGYPITSTRIRSGEIDEEGKLLRPLVVNVGSRNKAKIWATRDIFLKVFKKVEVHSVKVKTGISESPTDDEAIDGAINRAQGAIKEGDFGVGIECGLFQNQKFGSSYLVQYCAIVDKRGIVTTGHGPGFALPESAAASIREGTPIAEVIKRLLNVDSIKEEKGTVGHISGGLTSRRKLTEHAVLMALLPRIRSDLYPDLLRENP
jgi:inosine/xanthosine triphosphatase